MSARSSQRTARCTKGEGDVRLNQARKFLEVADQVQIEVSDFPSAASVAASLAVLAGIAASDAACCAALNLRSRAQDHRAAADLLRQILPGGNEAAARLSRLIDLKDTAHYGLTYVSGCDLRAALRAAEALVEFASVVVRRG